MDTQHIKAAATHFHCLWCLTDFGEPRPADVFVKTLENDMTIPVCYECMERKAWEFDDMVMGASPN